MAYDPHLSPHAGELDPDAIAARVFAEARRGFEPSEVQAYLQVVAEEFRAAGRREHELRLQIADLERQLLDTEERVTAAEGRARASSRASEPAASPVAPTGSLHALDEVELTILVGEETAKVLAAARNAASEIRANAERTAAEMHRKATEAADQIAARADDAAEQRAREVDADLARRHDEAEAAIGLANADAVEQAERIRADADRAVATVLADADQRVAEAHTTADQLVERARTDAADERARADADAARVVAEAKETGRQLMAEVQEVRHRMLGDLLRRRKLLRRQVEQLHAGRERFLVAFESARQAMADIDDELTRTLPEARSAAEAAGQRADARPDGPTAELEAMVTEAASARPDAGEPGPLDDDHPVSPSPADPPSSVFTRLRSDGRTDRLAPVAADDHGDDHDHDDDHDESTEPGRDELPARTVPHLVVVPNADHDDDAEPTPADPAPAETASSTLPTEVTAPDADAEASADPAREPGVPDAGPSPDAARSPDAVDPAEDPAAFDPRPARDALLDELTRPVVRRMKRSLTDEQNEVLDAIRRRRPLPTLDELLAPVAEHERRYAEAALPGLTKAAAAGQELPVALAEQHDRPGAGSTRADGEPEVPAVRDVAAALAVEVVGGLRGALERCLAGAELLHADPRNRAVGSKGPTKAAVAAQADAVADQVRLAYREIRTRRVDEAVTVAVQSSFARGLESAEPSDLAHQLRQGLAPTAASVLVD